MKKIPILGIDMYLTLVSKSKIYIANYCAKTGVKHLFLNPTSIEKNRCLVC